MKGKEEIKTYPVIDKPNLEKYMLCLFVFLFFVPYLDKKAHLNWFLESSNRTDMTRS